MRVLICGSREYTNDVAIAEQLNRLREKYGEKLIIIVGAARGADSIATMLCGEAGIKCTEYPAQWDVYGKAAGPIRNQQMLDEGKPHGWIAFDLGTRGTADMITRCKAAGLPGYVIDAHGYVKEVFRG